MKCKAKGNQGNWFAEVSAPRHPEVDGRSLPCIWDYWVQGKRYLDPGYAPGNPKAEKVVAALKDYPFAVMRKRRIGGDEDVWQADGYIAIYEVSDVQFGTELKFDLVRRVCDLR